MTDSQLLIGIMQNDERAWRHICRNMKPGFSAILGQTPLLDGLTKEDVEDIFQEAVIVLMQKARKGGIVISREGALFSCLVQIGKLTAYNAVRKRKSFTAEEMVTISSNLHKEYEDNDLSVDEKQRQQNEFLDRVFESIPSECQTLLKHFYWNHKPMDEIASILGMRNADSAKTKKNRCMQKFKEIAAKLIENEEFAEEAVRAATERAALKELLAQERIHAEAQMKTAALKVDEDTSEDDK